MTWPGYLRYVDDFALFHDSPAVLAEWRRCIGEYLARRRLSLHPRKTYTAATAEPTAFLGYVLLPNGRRRLPEDNVRRFRNRLRSMKDRLRAGSLTPEEAQPRIASWVAHAKHANTRRLRRALLRGGPFGPPPVAVDGTWGGAAAHHLPGHSSASPPGWSGSLAGP